MSDYTLYNASKSKSTATMRGRVSSWVREKTIKDKLMKFPGVALLILVSILFGLIGGIGGMLPAVGVLGLVVGVPVILASVLNLKLGLVLLLVLMFTILGIGRFIPELPVGITFDIFTAALVFGLIYRLVMERNFRQVWNPAGGAILLWIIYNIVLVFNPDAASKMAWVYTIRSLAIILLLYFVFLYTLDSVAYVKRLIYIWIGIALAGALYGIYQDVFGLMSFEWQWLNSDPQRLRRYSQFGNIRVWSFFSGPMVFGILMSLSAVASAFMGFNARNLLAKLFFFVTATFMLFAMVTSGTRASFIVPVIAIAVYLMMGAGFKEWILSGVGLILFLGLLIIPTGNPRLMQFQSAFKPTQDASFEVRLQNQDIIQPFIQSHPLGGGLGSTGAWGQRFSPNNPLAMFPPDSGFVRTAVEAGWVGLGLYMCLLFLIMYHGIRNYFMMQNPELKHLQLMFITILFALIITNYPQESINSPPINFIFLFSAAAVFMLKKLDEEPEEISDSKSDPVASQHYKRGSAG